MTIVAFFVNVRFPGSSRLDSSCAPQLASCRKQTQPLSHIPVNLMFEMFILFTSFLSILWTLYHNHHKLLSFLQVSTVLAHPWSFAHAVSLSLGFFLHYFPHFGHIKSTSNFRSQLKCPFCNKPPSIPGIFPRANCPLHPQALIEFCRKKI